MSSGVTGGRDNLATHTASSIASGFFASLVSVPADVVKTRMMSQVGLTHGCPWPGVLYASPRTCSPLG